MRTGLTGRHRRGAPLLCRHFVFGRPCGP